mgnify:CR=1 FL=1
MSSYMVSTASPSIGLWFANKIFVLDINVLLNNQILINLEMQIVGYENEEGCPVVNLPLPVFLRSQFYMLQVYHTQSEFVSKNMVVFHIHHFIPVPQF